jgi:hypothetical protein
MSSVEGLILESVFTSAPFACYEFLTVSELVVETSLFMAPTTLCRHSSVF